VADDARSYEWEGTRVGSGNMKILEEKENEYIDYDLNFIKPWKSQAKTNFTLSQEGDATKVTWVMDSSLPFFMFFMKGMMEAFVGADYERGLDMLKAYVEDNEVPSNLQFTGNKPFSGTNWVGIKTTCSIDEVGQKMEADFGKVKSLSEGKELADVQIASIYHKWDIPKNKVSYTACMFVKDPISDLPEGFVSGTIPEVSCYVLRHVGRYQHLGNAWSTLYSMHRNKEFKTIKGIHPFEIYVNDPQETPEKELVTDIYFPIK